MCVTYLVCDLLIFRDRIRPARRRAGADSPGQPFRRAAVAWDPHAPRPGQRDRPAGRRAGHGGARERGLARGCRHRHARLPRGGEPHHHRRRLPYVPESMGMPHCVVVVNDGSTDRTGEVAERLAAEYPGRVLVVHHEVTVATARPCRPASRPRWNGPTQVAVPDRLRRPVPGRATAHVSCRRTAGARGRGGRLPARAGRPVVPPGQRVPVDNRQPHPAAGRHPGRGLLLQAHRPAICRMSS